MITAVSYSTALKLRACTETALFATENCAEYEPVPVFVSETQSQPHTHD